MLSRPRAARLLPAALVLFAFGLLLPSRLVGEETAQKPVKMIFDTDLGNDVDDTMAVSVIHALVNRSECELLAVTVTKDNPFAGPCIDVLNTFYGRGDIPIGTVRNGVTPDDGKYLRQIVTATDNGKPRFPHKLQSGADAPEAVSLLRKTLAAQEDGSVVVLQVGFSTNLVRLLDSQADEFSPLSGPELVRRKVQYLSVMAGAFSPELVERRYCEYNVVFDIPSARRLVEEWPTPIVFSGYEIGWAIQYPGQSIQDDYRYVAHHPLAEAYDLYRGRQNDQPTWDLTNVLHAVRPERGYFDLSPPGRVTVEADGFTRFQPEENGPHRFLTVTPEQIARVREALVLLCSEPPKAPTR